MGASEWAYFVPYQPDIRQALQELRQSRFDQGDYVLVEPDWQGVSFQEWLEQGNPDHEELDEEERAEYEREFQRLQTLEEPKTIEELLEWNGTEGTSSILDMIDISDTPEWFKVSPLTEEQLITIFNTTQPTHEMVERADGAYHEFRERAEGLYIVVYKDGSPDEIFFTGFSGD